MFRTLLAAACLLLCGAAQAQPAVGVATVEARLIADGIRAEVRLSHPVLGFSFEDASVVREGDFEVLTDGLTLSGNRISSGSPFQRFTVLIRPMAHERDAKYPAFFRLGEGGVLFAPSLSGETRAWRTRLRLRTSRGQTLWPRNDVRGSVYIGPRAHVTAMNDVVLVAAPNTTQALRDAAVAEMRQSLSFYAQHMGVQLRTRPVMLLTHDADGGSGFVGDVTPAPTMSLRFYGRAWLAPDAASRADMRRYVAHESFHFWNGSLTSHRDGTPTWLHEGGADYAALLSARAAGELSDADVLKALGDALTNCRTNLRFLGDAAMNDLEFLSSGIRYPCGMAIQWASDLAIRAQSGEGDVLDAWGHVTRSAMAREDRKYDLADFTNYEGVSGSAPVISFLTEQSGTARWPALADTLRGLGATIEERPSHLTRSEALLMHLSILSCATGSRGYGSTRGEITVNAECGPLASGPVVTSVEGAHPGDVSAEHYARLQGICAASGNLALVLNGTERVSLPCRRPLPPAQTAFVVTASPTLN